MQKTWTKALRDSISDVFSTMFFMVPEEAPGLAQDLDQGRVRTWVEGWVDMEGPEGKARVLIWAPVELARELGANILSLEPEDLAEEDMLDAYREMLNMVAGNHLTLVDDQGNWRMGLPGTSALQEAAAPPREQAQWVLYFDVEGTPLVAGCRLEEN